MASTSGGAGVIVSALLAFISQFNEMIPYEKYLKSWVTSLKVVYF